MKNRLNNPIRRNRNIGTPKSGHGQNNSMRIPESWHDERVFWSKVINPVFLTSKVANKEITIIVEPVNAGFVHHVTPWDVEKICSVVGEHRFDELAAIVLRQPKRKERILNPAWGRFVWHADIGNAHGPMIMIEAQETGFSRRWDKSLKPEGVKELDRLKGDGHEIVSDKRYHHITGSADAIRNTQLYRTLLHELGHYEDYRTSIIEKDDGAEDRFLDLVEQYDQRTSDQKEQYAHQFAEKLMRTLVKSGLAPFKRQIDIKALAETELSSAWFTSDDA